MVEQCGNADRIAELRLGFTLDPEHLDPRHKDDPTGFSGDGAGVGYLD